MTSKLDHKMPQLHLLRSLTNTTPSTSLEDSLEERISKLEKEIKKSIAHLEKQIGRSSSKKSGLDPKFREDLKNLQHLFEEKLHHLENPPQAPRANFFKKLTYYLTLLFSLRTYRRFLFGITKIDREEFDEFGRDPQFEQKLKPFFDFLYYTYWRVSVEGLENIPNHGRGLIVANHSGTLPFDGSMIRLAVTNDHPSKRDVRFLVEDFVYYLPFIGTYMYRIGGVRASPDNAERLLNKGHLVTVFPEGEKGIGKSYKHRYHLQRFGRGGFIKVAIRSGAPIIPCAVIGAEETHPLLYRIQALAKPFGIPYVPITPTLPWLGVFGLIGLPAKWQIHFGKPIHLGRYGEKALNDELLIHRLSEMVRQNIQELVMKGLKKRRSIWWG